MTWNNCATCANNTPCEPTGSEQPRLRLFDVTLDWNADEPEEGDYGTTVWATSSDEAVRRAAEEMVDSGEIELPREGSPGYASVRERHIRRIADGATIYAAIDVSARILRDIEQILAGPGDEARNSVAFKTDFEVMRGILRKYIPV